jgi:uncharacterized membrane protein
MRSLATRPGSAALAGFLFVLPFFIANAIVGNRIEPFFSLIRPGLHTSAREYVLLAIVLLLLPAGAFIALSPMLRRGADGTRRFYLLNGLIAALLLVAFAVLSIALGSEIYRCDVLKIPNCD